MARLIHDTPLESRAARSRLRKRSKPYYRSLEPGLHLGYRKPPSGVGKWIARHYIGDQAYQLETIGVADDYSDADGVAVLSYRQALTKARERMVARAHNDGGGKRGPLTVRDAVEAHLEFMETHRKSGYDSRRRAEAFILPALGDIEVAALTTEQLRRWLAALAKTPARTRSSADGKQRYRKLGDDESIRRRRVTANRTLTQLKAALNLAWREGRTPSDAAWRRVRPFEGVDMARTRFLSIEECRRLINASTPEFRRLVRAGLATGARYGELCRLQVRDFDADSGTVAIHVTKTGRPRRVVLADEGIALFRELCAGRAGDETLLQRDSGQPWGTSQQSALMKDACGHARITPPATFHCLRHTYASLSTMAGMPLTVLSKVLGHADSKLTEAVYSHLAPDYLSETVRRFAPKLGIKPSKRVTPLR